MSKIDDGNAAFPSELFEQPGMTLRDYFAAAALTGLLQQRQEKGDYSRASQSTVDDDLIGLVYVGSFIGPRDSGDEYDAATDAYKFADAMLEARKEDND